jgi:hypothetical protein
MVGDEMEKLIPDWAVQFNEECGCKNFKNKMNKWGIQGCKDNRKKIIDHLMKQSSNLVPVLQIFPNVMKRIGVNMLLDKAISNAEKNYIPEFSSCRLTSKSKKSLTK